MSAPVEKTTPEVTNEKATPAAAPAKKEAGRFDKTFGTLYYSLSVDSRRRKEQSLTRDPYFRSRCFFGVMGEQRRNVRPSTLLSI